MAKQGAVRLSGRFPPGTEVKLIRVAGAHVLRSEGGEEVGSKKVDSDGVVEFTTGVEPDARYFITGYGPEYREVRARGRARDEVTGVVEQPPIGPDRVRLSDGSWLDEPPEQHQTPPSREVGPAPGQHQVPKGTVQRSDTLRGTAHPMDPKEPAPYRAQEEVPEGTVQMSDTPGFEDPITGREISGGRATEIVQSVQRQEDAPAGMLQRSDTPHGVATPIPSGDAVQAQLDKESAAAKESRGAPGRAAAEPLGKHAKLAGAGKGGASKGRTPSGAPNDRDNVSGHDAMGQPAYADVLAAEGLEPASSPLEPVTTRGKATSLEDAKDAKPADDPLKRLADPPQEAGASETEEATTGAGEPKPTGEHSVTKATPRRKSSSTSRSRAASKSTKAKGK